MAYIPPSGDITFYAGIPRLTPDYEHTLLFYSRTFQQAYFQNHTRNILSDQQYTRRGRGVIRVKMPIVQLSSATYFSFLNSDGLNPEIPTMEERRFYCFINQIEYVNNGATDIYFQIDVMQTYLYDLTFLSSYVNRECVSLTEDSGIKEETYRQYMALPEDLDIGDYDFTEHPILIPNPDQPLNPYVAFRRWVWVVAATFDQNFADAVGGMKNGYYSGLAFLPFDNVTSLNQFLLDAASRNKADGIVSIYMSPVEFASVNDTLTYINDYFSIEPADRYAYDSTYGYMPHNGKLYRYPYCGMLVTDHNGTSAEYKYEFFGGQMHNSKWSALIRIYGCTGCGNEFAAVPYLYMGSEGYNHNERLIINYTPMISYATDSYRAWLAQNGSKMAIERSYSDQVTNIQMAASKRNAQLDHAKEIANTAAEIGKIAASTEHVWNVGGAVAAGVATTAASVIRNTQTQANAVDTQKILGADHAKTIGLLNAAEHVAMTTPPQAHGSSSGSVGVVSQGFGFAMYKFSITRHKAEQLDHYLDMFGYRVDRDEVPDLRTRKYWNYIKCASFNASGPVPGDDYEQIKRIFERGVTFWHCGAQNLPGNFLDYSQDNYQAYTRP